MRSNIFWIALTFLSTLLLFAVITWLQIKSSRTCHISQILTKEIQEIRILYSELAKFDSQQNEEAPSLADLMNKDFMSSRQTFHWNMLYTLSLDIPALDKYLKNEFKEITSNQIPEKFSRISINSYISWLSNLDLLLNNSYYCDNLIDRFVKLPINNITRFKKLEDEQKYLTTEWNHKLEINQSLAQAISEDFKHDRSILCHSRKNLEDLINMKNFVIKECQNSKYLCKTQLENLTLQINELISLEQINTTNFINKWSKNWLRPNLCRLQN